MFDLDAYLEPIGLARPSGDWSELALTEQTPTGRTVTPVELGAIPQLLEGRLASPASRWTAAAGWSAV